jgi:hypothetical protein
MTARVIDTNVLIVANGKTEQASLDCLSCCVAALDEAKQHVVVVDDAFLIFGEYKHEVSPSGQPGIGDAFLLWLLRNWDNIACCETVLLTPDNFNSFQEFPDDPDLADFDPSDHKFVAVANASIHKPEVLNAVDSDWWIHGKVLRRNGIEIVHVCKEQVTFWEKNKTQK